MAEYRINAERMGGQVYYMIEQRIGFWLFKTKWLFLERWNTIESAMVRIDELRYPVSTVIPY